MVLCFVQIDKLYNCVYILSYQFIVIKRTSHKPLHDLVIYVGDRSIIRDDIQQFSDYLYLFLSDFS